MKALDVKCETTDVGIYFLGFCKDELRKRSYLYINHLSKLINMIALKHKKLDVWKLAIELTVDIYRLTKLLPNHELYGLTSQLRRASVSISSNIAEGAARKSSKERCRFYEIARSSLVEVDTPLELASKLNYFTDKELKTIEDKLEHTFAMLSNLIKNT